MKSNNLFVVGSALLSTVILSGKSVAAEYIPQTPMLYAASSDDSGVSTRVDSSGSIYVAVSIADTSGVQNRGGRIIKYTPAGTEAGAPWPINFGGKIGALAVEKSTGAVFATGTAKATGRNDTDCKTVKYNANGLLAWEKYFNVSANGQSSNQYCNDIALDSSGDVIVGGRTDAIGSSNFQSILVKYAGNNGNQKAATYFYVVLPSMNYTTKIAVGKNYVFTITVNDPSHYYITRHNVSNLEMAPLPGNIQYHNTAILVPHDIASNDKDEIFVAGWVPPNESDGTTYYYHKMMAYDSNGWRKCVHRYEYIPGSGSLSDFYDSYYGITLDNSGGIYLTGADVNDFITQKFVITTTGPDANGKYTHSCDPVWVDANGKPDPLRWNNPSFDKANEIDIRDNGDIIITGTSKTGGGTIDPVYDAVTIQYTNLTNTTTTSTTTTSTTSTTTTSTSTTTTVPVETTNTNNGNGNANGHSK